MFNFLKNITKNITIFSNNNQSVEKLTQKRDIFEKERSLAENKLTSLENREIELLNQGSQATLNIDKKQIAQKLIKTRKDLSVAKSEYQICCNQIDILNIHIHNLITIQRIKTIDLPNSEELTKMSSEAEIIVRQLSECSDLAKLVSCGINETDNQDEINNIMEEFKSLNTSPVQITTQTEETVQNISQPEKINNKILLES